MGKYDDTLAKIRDFFDGLTGEAKSKCALCNETLTHIVKMAEVETGAGTATVTKVLAEQLNEGAAEGDKVNGNALRVRVQHHEGKTKCRIPANEENPDAPTVKPGDNGDIVREVERKVRAGKSVREAAGEVADNFGKNPETVRKAYNRVGDPARASQAFDIVGFAIAQLQRLNRDDPKCEEALLKLETWIQKFKEQK